MRAIVLAGLVACGTSPAPSPVVESRSAKPVTSVTRAPAAAAPPATTPAATDVFARVRPDLVGCYEAGKKALPSMGDGKVTFHAAVDQGGTTTCVFPSDDIGLSEDVERCMRERLERETYAKTGAPWSVLVPIVVKGGAVSLGEPRTKPEMFETIESQGLAEDVYDVVDTLLPELYTCVRGAPRARELRLIYVGGKLAGDGHMSCALASSPSASIAPEVRACTAKVLLGAKFRAPKKGYGLVSVPLNVVGGT